MPTSSETIDYFLDVLKDAGDVAAKQMFGGHTLYLDGRVVGLICGGSLFLKPTPGARAILPDTKEAPPYEGAKPHLNPDEELNEPEKVISAMRAILADLPPPKPKKRKQKLG